MRTANREKPLPHKLCSFTSSLCTCPASSASIECIFSTYRLVWSNIRKSLNAEKATKIDYNLRKPVEFTQTVRVILKNFSSPQNFPCCSLFHFKKLQLTVQVCCIFYFLFHGTFFIGEEKSRIFGGFYCFF